MKIIIEVLPAYTKLIATAYDIMETHGQDRAVEWLRETLSRDYLLFMRLGKPRPKLTVIRGGA
jgi:hypothetical protein